MKINLQKRTDLGTMRILRELKNAVVELCEKESFEKISVQKICELSLVPRATFYNYFEDKYDLMHYFWNSVNDEIATNLEHPDYSFDTILGCISAGFDYLEDNRVLYEKIIKKNPLDGEFIRGFENTIRNRLEYYFIESPNTDKLKYDFKLTAKICTSTIMIVLLRKIEYMEEYSKEEAISFLEDSLNYQKLGIIKGSIKGYMEEIR